MNSAACQIDDLKRPTVRSVPGPVEVDRVEPPLGQRGRAPLQRLHPLRPGGDGIVLVEPADVRDRLPEPVERLVGLGVGIDDLGPLRRRSGRDAPVRGAAVDDRPGARQVREGDRARSARPARRRARAAHAARSARSARACSSEKCSIRSVIQGGMYEKRLRVAVEQPLALDPLVGVPDVDELGAALVGGSARSRGSGLPCRRSS